MQKDKKIKFIIDFKVLNGYINTINSLKDSMIKVKQYLNDSTSIIPDYLHSITTMITEEKKYLSKYPQEKAKIYTDIIMQLMDVNNGILSSRMLEPLNISKQYISIMVNKKIIEKISRGIYVYSNTFEDSYFSFQQKYKRTIFSHMNALYFHGLTEEIPYEYTVTVPRYYHTYSINKKCNVFYVADDIYELGIIEIKTPNGNKVRVYDKERCICDIIKNKRRMDFEQVKKAIKNYVKSPEKDLAKLSNYSNKMGINKKVMEIMEVYNE